MTKRPFFCWRVFFLFALAVFVSFFLLRASVSAQKSADAIAFRVVANPKHHSPARWYDENIKIKGSPSEVMVDGYRAVRDGRTVYVGAANYDSGSLYTNIYIISYNQEAETATVDIFGQILAYWRFNINLETKGNCSTTPALACINDRECLVGDFCTSLKGEVVRNTRRLADIADIETLLEKYKNVNGKFPTIYAGSYMARKTLSAWPSWQETLGKELKATLPVDPINRLGACPGYDPITCWNATSSSFAGTLPDDLSATSTPPAGSEVYIYRVTPDGLAYTLFTTSVDPITIISGEELTGTITNRPPRIEVPPGSTVIEGGTSYINIIGYTGKPFSYFVKAFDPDSDLGSLSLWSINIISPAAWSAAGWTGLPILATTSQANIKEVRAPIAGQQGFYYFDITVNDGDGGSDLKHFRVSITNQAPIVTITPAAVNAVAGRNNLVTNPIIIKAVDPEGNYPLTNNSASLSLPAGLSWQVIDQETYHITGMPTYVPTTVSWPPLTITFTDSFGMSGSANLNITLVNRAPVFTTSPVLQVRVGANYNYDANATDADGHTVYFQFASTPPAGFTINNSTGLISGSSTVAGNYNMVIRAYDGWGATTTQNWILAVTSFCGDSVVQVPNDEGKAEQCDDGNTINTDACANTCDWTCESLGGSPYVNLDTGLTDSIITDDNNNPDDSQMALGQYLKLARVMPTPYLWIANTSHASISKIRAFDGFRKTVSGLDITTMEYRGQVIGNYPLTLGALTASDPSRTAVNAETGEVWVLGRASHLLAKLDIDGNVLKICDVGGSGMARGVAIEENGDVWAANYTLGRIYKFSGDNSSCAILATSPVGGAPYGLAIDSQNYMVVANQGAGTINRFNVATPLAITSYGAVGNYGITVDLNDNIWSGNWSGGSGFYKVPFGAANGSAAINYPVTNSITGVTLDTAGNVWGSGNAAGVNVVKINSASGTFIFANSLAGYTPHGIVGDSQDQVWVVTYENMIRAYDLAGNTLASVCVNDINGNGNCGDDGVQTYTYSDMSGLNRAMLLRAGDRVYTYESGFDNQHWGPLNWEQVDAVPNQTVAVYVRAANATSSFAAMPWFSYVEGSSLNSIYGRFLQIRVVLRSRERNVTPVFYNLSNTCAVPKGTLGASCVDSGSGACLGCIAACGGGTCTGTRIDNCGYSHSCTITNATVCPVSCALPQNLTCPGSIHPGYDDNNLDTSAFDEHYSLNNGWGYSSLFSKPTAWPAIAVSGVKIAVAYSSCCYQGEIYCTNGTIYKRYTYAATATATPVTYTNACP